MNNHCSKWIIYYTGLAITLLCLVGCSVLPPSSAETPPAATSTSLPGVTSSPTSSPPSPTLTPTPIASPTLTAHPTLTADERQAFMREMLETNGGCELPCWWGIIPGEAEWQAVLNRFIAYGGFNFEIPHLTRPYDYMLDLSLDHKNGVIQSISVMSFIYPGGRSERFPQDWHRYSLDQLLTRHGAPSQVMLEFWPNPPSPYYPYSLFVFYDHLGILIRYGGSAIPGESFRMCPELAGVEFLNLWLRSPGEGPALLELANLDRAELVQLLSLEEATGMDIQTFYATFREADTTVCLESPVEVWP